MKIFLILYKLGLKGYVVLARDPDAKIEGNLISYNSPVQTVMMDIHCTYFILA